MELTRTITIIALFFALLHMSDERILRACPYCGSLDTHPALLFGGPIPWVDHNDGGYICNNCGRTAVPLDFRDLDELISFQKSLSMKIVEANPPDFMRIPLVPLAGRLTDKSSINLPVANSTLITQIEWQNGKFVASGASSTYSQYLRAISIAIGRSSAIALMDLNSINGNEPFYDILKKLIKSKNQVWLDIRMDKEDDIFDAFSLDISKAMLSTATFT